MIAVALLGCGPSAGQVREAREARYTAAPDVVFEGAYEGVKSIHKIAAYDPQKGLIETDDRWYEPDGTLADRSADDAAYVTDGSILLSFLIGVQGEPGAWQIEVMPIAYQHLSGSPQAREMRPDDPQMPGWVQGKIDNIYLAIHGRLKEHAVAPEPAPPASGY